MRSERNIKRLIGNLHDTTSSEMDKRVLGDALGALAESEKTESAITQPSAWRAIMKSRAVRLAAAAVIVAAVGLFAVHQRPHQQVPPIAGVVESPAKMMTIMSLSKAYRHGGIDAIDKQFDKVFETLGPRSTSISVGELLEDLNG